MGKAARIKQEKLTEEQRVLERLINHFPSYLMYVYKHIGLPSPTPLQNRIANIIYEAPDRMIMEAARGTGKSWIGAIYTTWRLLRNIDEKILIVSAAGPKAIEIATFVRRLFENVPLLNHLRPNKDQRDSVLAFDVAGCKDAIAPSVAAVGIGGQLTGRRATFILSDDVEVPANSATELQRENLMQKVQEYESLLVPDVPSKVLFLGTPQSMESIYNKLPYHTTILPAEVPEDETIYEGKLDPWVLKQGPAGTAVDAVRFPLEELAKRKAGMGLTNYQLQFMLDTTLSDANRFPLKQKDMIMTSLNHLEGPMSIAYTGSARYIIEDIPNIGFTGDVLHSPLRVSTDYKAYDTLIMSIDPSGTGDDETTWAIIGVISGNVYLIDWGGTKLGYSTEALTLLAMKAKEYGVHEIVPEKNFGSGMFTELFGKVLNAVYPCTIVDDFVSKGQKEIRIIDNIEPLLTNHQFVVNEDRAREELAWVQENPKENLQYSLFYQLTHITREKQSLTHDDRLDALAIGIQYVADQVRVDAEEVLKRIKEKEMSDWLDAKVYGKRNTLGGKNILGSAKRGRN